MRRRVWIIGLTVLALVWASRSTSAAAVDVVLVLIVAGVVVRVRGALVLYRLARQELRRRARHELRDLAREGRRARPHSCRRTSCRVVIPASSRAKFCSADCRRLGKLEDHARQGDERAAARLELAHSAAAAAPTDTIPF